MAIKHQPALCLSKLADVKIGNIRRFTRTDSKNWSAFNPSIGYSPTLGYALTVRSSNYTITDSFGELHLTEGGFLKNEVWFTETNENMELLDFRKVSFENSEIEIKRGVEDSKLFWRDNKWHFTGVVMEKHTPVARVGVFELDAKKSAARLVKLHSGPLVKKPEKNWMIPYEINSNFDYVYASGAVVKDNCVITTMSDNIDVAPLRGNTNLHSLGDGTYLSLMHILYTSSANLWDPRIFSTRKGLYKNYTHVFTRHNEYGALVECSPQFHFISEGIEFAAGIVEMGDDFVITFGKDDVTSHYARVGKKDVMKMLKPISM